MALATVQSAWWLLMARYLLGARPSAAIIPRRLVGSSLRWRHNGHDGVSNTSLTIVYSTVYSDAYQRKHQSPASLAFVGGIHREPVNSPPKWPVTRKMIPFDDVIMYEEYPIVYQWNSTGICSALSNTLYKESRCIFRTECQLDKLVMLPPLWLIKISCANIRLAGEISSIAILMALLKCDEKQITTGASQHYNAVTWALRRLKSLATRQFFWTAPSD